MSCFSCFSSPEKKAGKRSNSSRRVQSESGSARGAPPPHHTSPPPPPSAHKQQPSRSPSPNQRQNLPETKKSDEKVGNGNIAAQTFTFRELATATRNFRQECLLGEGGFGRVYKGSLNNGAQLAAIKQLDRNGLQGNKEFLVEVLMLSLLHHDNLVNLIGYCADGDQRLLVYEYMSKGSVEDHLLDLSSEDKPLGWYTRMKIATGAAKGLEYLHDKANPPVIYRDLKSSNILLDEEFNPKLSDFGLAKLGPTGDKTHVSSRVMGTYGYCAPEYARTGQLTLKSDVYSFGVVLLELITGRRAIDTTKPTEEQNLVSWAQPYFKDPSRFPNMADPLLAGDFPVRGLNQAVAVAAMCLQEEADVRPLMSDVVTALSFLSTPTEGTKPLAPNPIMNSFAKMTSARTQKKDDNDDDDDDDEEESDDDSDTGSDDDDDDHNEDDESEERQRAVAEAIEWGSNSREENRRSQGGSGSI